MKNEPRIIAAFLDKKEKDNWRADGTSPIVTISKQCGAGGEAIALRTLELLNKSDHGEVPWIVVDRNIAEHVIQDHHLPKQISQFFSEEQTLSIEEHINALLGITVPGRTRIDDLTRTIVRLARIGHVIFVGRAAHLITALFPRSLHVRVIGSVTCRVERVIAIKKCDLETAKAEIKEIDHQRRHFISTYFQSDIDDVTRYDLVLNTDRMTVEESASVIARLVSNPQFREEKAKQLSELRHLVLDNH